MRFQAQTGRRVDWRRADLVVRGDQHAGRGLEAYPAGLRLGIGHTAVVPDVLQRGHGACGREGDSGLRHLGKLELGALG